MSLFVLLVLFILAGLAARLVWRSIRNKQDREAVATFARLSEVTEGQGADAWPSTERWTVELQGVKYGPFSFAQLQRFKADGILEPAALLHAESDGRTVAAGDLDGLFPSIAPKVDFPEHAVAFQTFSGRHDPVFRGSGRVKVSGGVLTLSGSRRRLFAWGKRLEEIPLNRIRDVGVSGREVKFAVDDQKGERLLRMKSKADAALLAQCLPGRVSAAWAQQKRDNQAFERFMGASRPWVTISIIALNLVIFAAIGLGGGGWSKVQPSVLAGLGGNLGILTTQGDWWRLVASLFLHGGLLHVTANMIAFWEAGRVTERLFGHFRYLLIYLAVGILASLASINWHQDVVSVGASGAIFGIYGVLLAALVLDPSLLPPTVTQRLRAVALVFIGYALMQSFGQRGIDHAAHIGGLIAGLLVGSVLVMPRSRALAVGACVVVLACAGVWHARESTRPYDDEVAFRAFLPTLASEEKRLGERAREIFTGASQLQPAAVADQIEQELIPGWQGLHERLVSMPRLLPASLALYAPLVAYVNLKYESLKLFRDGLRKEDEAMLGLATQRLKEANAQGAALKQAIEAGKEAQKQRDSGR